MKIPLKKPLPDNIYNLMRRLGYKMQYQRGDQISFVRPLDSSGYPRFHIYFKEDIITLHLDQKRPLYRGSPAHSGEYEGEIITKEAERINRTINEER